MISLLKSSILFVLSFIGIGIPLCYIGHWSIATTYYVSMTMMYLILAFCDLIEPNKTLDKYIAGALDPSIYIVVLLQMFIVLSWIVTFACYDYGIYFILG